MKQNNINLFGDLVNLRLISIEDIDKYFEMGFEHGHKELNYYTGTKTEFTKEMIDKYVHRIVNDETRYDFLIYDKSNNMLGEVVINDIDELCRRANFRISLFKSVLCGKGYGTQAAELLITYAFENLKLHRIELEVFSFNIRAKKSYNKLGFIEEGIKRDGEYIDGEFRDVIVMAMLESDYKSKKAICDKERP